MLGGWFGSKHSQKLFSSLPSRYKIYTYKYIPVGKGLKVAHYAVSKAVQKPDNIGELLVGWMFLLFACFIILVAVVMPVQPVAWC